MQETGNGGQIDVAAPNTCQKACTRVISRPFTATQLLKTILLRGYLPRLSVIAKILI